MDEAQERGMRMIVLATGGEIGFVLDETENVVVTGLGVEVRDTQCLQGGTGWRRRLGSRQQTRERSRALKMASVELKRIKSDALMQHCNM